MKDYTGQTFGRLTFLRPTEDRYRKSVIWELQCSCGNKTHVISYDVVSGNTTSCGCYRKQMLAKHCKTIGAKTRRYDPIVSSARMVWSNYKECDFETFYKISQQPCYYCGAPPSNKFNAAGKPSSKYKSAYQLECGDFTYNGLDRLDNTRDHSPDNVVPCCFDCNRTKSNHTLEEFLRHIERMYHGTRRLITQLSDIESE
jgi:hypothetical protein